MMTARARERNWDRLSSSSPAIARTVSYGPWRADTNLPVLGLRAGELPQLCCRGVIVAELDQILDQKHLRIRVGAVGSKGASRRGRAFVYSPISNSEIPRTASVLFFSS
jgi:hypothetical protein